VGSRSSGTVVVVAPALSDNELRLVSGLRRVLAAADLHPLVAVSEPGRGLSPQVARLLRGSEPFGAVIAGGFGPVERRSMLSLVRGLGIPCVGVSTDVPDLPSVRTDNAAAIRDVVTHLVVECGARRLAFVRGSRHDADAQAREEAFRRHLASLRLPVDDGLVVDGDYAYDPTYRRMRGLLAFRPDIDAVVASSDTSASAVVAAALDCDLRVPDDLLVTGFDASAFGARTLPTLTTVDPDYTRQGEEAGRILLAAVERTQYPRHVVVPARLVARGTTSRPDDVTLASASRLVHQGLGARGTILSVNRALMRCETVDEVVEVLASSADRLEVRTLALVVRDHRGASPDVPDARDGEGPADARVALLIRDGRVESPPAGGFPPCRILPDELVPMLRSGLTVMHPLEVPGHEIGYVLSELPPRGDSVLVELLSLDLGRSLAGVLSRTRIAEHAATLEQLVARRTHELQHANAGLRQMNAGLQRSLMLDGLTGINNRRAFERHLESHWARLAHTGGEMSLLMIDVDLFKSFNDHYGHVAGDETLRIIAACLHESLRGVDDLAARYGGEEFAAVLPDAGHETARAIARRFAAILQRQAVPHAASTVSEVVTASVGVATAVPHLSTSPERLVTAADEALYEAKAIGRNRIRSRDLTATDVAVGF
jgi:diguanylate cyclase (GGDEF)-like protein